MLNQHNGVATLICKKPETEVYGLHEGHDSEDVRILKIMVKGIPIINTYVPQGQRNPLHNEASTRAEKRMHVIGR